MACDKLGYDGPTPNAAVPAPRNGRGSAAPTRRTGRYLMPQSWQRALYIPLIVLAWLAILLIGGWLLAHIAKTILTLLLSGVAAVALTPLVSLLARVMPRSLAIAVAYVLGFVVILGLLSLYFVRR